MKKKFFTQKSVYTLENFTPKISIKSPLENEMYEFIDCINKNKKPLTSTKLSLIILDTLEKLNRI